jgi:DNA-binding SARP family transcriptional activator
MRTYGDAVRVRLLGPVDVVVDGVPRVVRGLRRRAVLAALALRPGQVVTADHLIRVIWDDDAPGAAAATLQSHVSHLRGVLGDRSSIVGDARGYRLHADTDAQAAEALIERGLRTADPAGAKALLREAVELWRGRPLGGVEGLAWFDRQAERFDRLLQQARDALVEARLALGEHDELIAELPGPDPYHEPAHGQLMLALHRAGRSSDALAAYQRVRQILADDLGAEPGRPLRELEAAIRRQDRALDLAAPARPAPAQLPLAPAGFAGRAAEMAALPGDGVVVVSGTAGVGKTSLAVQWAHRNAGRFPDGRLYVNLRGFDPGGAVATDPAEAIRGFLDAFGVPAERIPAGLPAQAELYRETLAGRRVLIVLDNARNADQVRPLLPGVPECLVVVTSRDRLGGLDARSVTLDLLTPGEADELLTRRLGAERVAAEPDAVRRIVDRCARLPLALAIVAARAAIRPDATLAALAGELDGATLDALRSGDPATDVRVVLSWSLRAVSPAAARLFRLLSHHPGLSFGTHAAASLAGLPPDRAVSLLDELTRANLLAEAAPGRFGFHDLLRAFAAEQNDRSGDDGAMLRLLDHYLHTAHPAALRLYPRWDRLPLEAPRAGVAVVALGSYEAALDWFTSEHGGLVALVERAAAAGSDAHAWQLAWVFTAFLLRRGYSDEQAAVSHIALAAAGRLGDRVGQGNAERGLAMSHERWGRFEVARSHFEKALLQYAEAGEHFGQAHTHIGLTSVAERLGDAAGALRHAEQAREQARQAGDRPTEAHALNAIGWCHAQLGNHQQALDHCWRSLTMLDELGGDRDGEALSWDSLGYIYKELGDYAQAVTCYRRCIDLFEALGDRYFMADSLVCLGDVHAAAGSADDARAAWQQALDVLVELGHPDAEGVRARL